MNSSFNQDHPKNYSTSRGNDQGNDNYFYNKKKELLLSTTLQIQKDILVDYSQDMMETTINAKKTFESDMAKFSLENLSMEWGLSNGTKNYLRDDNINNMNGNILEELKIFRQNANENLPSTIQELEEYSIECYEKDFIIFTRDEKLYIINSIITQLQLFVLRVELIIFLLEAQISLANNGNSGIVLGALGSNYNIISCLISAITVVFKKTSNNTSSLDWKREIATLKYKRMNKKWAYALIEGNIYYYNEFTGHEDNTKIIIIERMVLQNLALFEIFH
uniref:Uncharacterized protein n=1 Tax=Meloidogyne enterolobii TaxID=390850 RepID=A0A6V7UB65_MELEN|nr:unnamed protein product [Meloidogyne enterolobii]